uniref:Uncharacterized protein n=1 Tax=Glossina pallidipes TaxID=7398 RepID=A0A1A9ZW21_GLOPL
MNPDIVYEDIEYLDIDLDIYNQWPSTSAAAAKLLQQQRQHQLEPEEEHQDQARQETVPEVEPLRALVNELDPLDKVVTLAFDELFTNNETTCLPAEDRLYGCVYDANGWAVLFATVLIFWARSIFTSFNMLLSTHNLGQTSGGAQELFEDWMNLGEVIKLQLKPVICDRSPTNRVSLRGFRNGIYMKRREGGCPYKVRRIFDYAHLVDSHQRRMRSDTHYDIDLISKLVEQRKESSSFWVQRGAVPSVVKATNFPVNIAFFSNANSAYVRGAVKTQRANFYRNRTTDDNDYQLTELLDCRVQNRPKKPPFGLDGEGFEVIEEIQTPQQAEEYLRLLTGYAVGQVIRDELRCLSDFAIQSDQATNKDVQIATSSFLRPMFVKEEMQAAFKVVYKLLYQIFQQYMLKIK